MKKPYVRRDTTTGTLYVRARGEWEGPFATEQEALARRDELRDAGVSASPDPEPVARIGIPAPTTDLVTAAKPTRDEHVTAVKRRVADLAAQAEAAREIGTVPTCPECGFQRRDGNRHKIVRPHGRRVMTSTGIRDTGEDCPGTGQLAEYVTPYERTPL